MSANDPLVEDDESPAVRLAGSILARTQQAIETRRALDAVKPSLPAKIVQFRIPFPEETPPVSNVIARSALFAAVKSKDRRMMKDEVVASQDGIQISFTGEQLMKLVALGTEGIEQVTRLQRAALGQAWPLG